MVGCNSSCQSRVGQSCQADIPKRPTLNYHIRWERSGGNELVSGIIVAALTVCFLAFLSVEPDPSKEPHIIAAAENSTGNAQSVAISANGQLVAAGFGGSLRGRFPEKPNGGGVFVWERESGKVVLARGEFGDVVKVGFSRDGRFLAYCRVYTPGDSIEATNTVLIDLQSNELVKQWGGSQVAFAFSPTEDLLVVSGSRTSVFDLKSRTVARTVDVRGARAFDFSADGRTVAGLCDYWEGRRGSPDGLAVFSPHQEQPQFIIANDSVRSANAIALSPSGQQVVTGHTGGLAKIWNVKQQASMDQLQLKTPLAVFPFFSDEGKSLTFATQPANGISWKYDGSSPSGFQFAKGKPASSSDLFRFDPESSKQNGHWRFENASFRTFYARFGRSRHYPEYNPARFALSRDGKTLIAGCNGCCLIDWATGRRIREFVRGQPDDGQKASQSNEN